MNTMELAVVVLISVFAPGCGQIPPITANVTTSGTSAQATTSTTTCPSGTAVVQGKTCEETTVRSNATQAMAATYCANAVMHLCSIAERTGQFALAKWEQVGQKYWLSDFSGGQGYVVMDNNAEPVVGGSYPFFCCVTGT